MRVKDCMNSDVIWAEEQCSIEDIAKLMNENHVGSIPICNNAQNVVGIITDRDIILRTIATGKQANQTKASDIMTQNVIKTSKDTDIAWVADIMAKNQIRRVPVVENEKLVGIVSIGDLLRNKNFSNNQAGECACKICSETNQNAE